MANSISEAPPMPTDSQKAAGLIRTLGKLFWLTLALAAFCGALWLTALNTETFRDQALQVKGWVTGGWAAEQTSGNGVVSGATLGASNPDDSVSQSALEANEETTTYTTAVSVVEASTSHKAEVKRVFTGVVKPRQSSQVGFKQTGKVERVFVREGDLVERGKVLAKLDTRLLEAEKGVLQAEMDAATALLDELISGPRKEKIAAAQARLREYQSVVELNKITTGRRERLVQENAGSRQSFDNARLEQSAAEARVESQQQVVNELLAGTRKEKVAAQQAVVEKLKAGVKRLEIQIEEGVLTAPYDAVVSQRQIDDGDIVTPGQPVLKLVETAEPEAWIGLPVQSTESLETDRAYSIDVGTMKIKSRLRTILPEVDPLTRTRTAIFDLELAERAGYFGQLARVELRRAQAQEGFWIPRASLTYGNRGLWSVFVAVPMETNAPSSSPTHRLRRQDVEVILFEDEQVLVRGTIKPGDLIVAGGVQKLTAGQQVTVQASSN